MELIIEYDGNNIVAKSNDIKVTVEKSGHLDVLCLNTNKRLEGSERVEALKMVKSDCVAMRKFWTTVISSNADRLFNSILSIE